SINRAAQDKIQQGPVADEMETEERRRRQRKRRGSKVERRGEQGLTYVIFNADPSGAGDVLEQQVRQPRSLGEISHCSSPFLLYCFLAASAAAAAYFLLTARLCCTRSLAGKIGDVPLNEAL